MDIININSATTTNNKGLQIIAYCVLLSLPKLDPQLLWGDAELLVEAAGY
jgi:hypothetical protein